MSVLFESFLCCAASTGLEHLQKRQYTAAFHLFKLAADQNYSKAQFNVGLCYEHGRGTEKDVAKVLWPFSSDLTCVFSLGKKSIRQPGSAQRCVSTWNSLAHHSPETHLVFLAGVQKGTKQRCRVW